MWRKACPWSTGVLAVALILVAWRLKDRREPSSIGCGIRSPAARTASPAPGSTEAPAPAEPLRRPDPQSRRCRRRGLGHVHRVGAGRTADGQLSARERARSTRREAGGVARTVAQAGRANRSLDVGERDDADGSSLLVDDGGSSDPHERGLVEQVGDLLLAADQQGGIPVGQFRRARRRPARPGRSPQVLDAQHPDLLCPRRRSLGRRCSGGARSTRAPRRASTRRGC